MTAVLGILLALVAWTLLSLPLAVLVGRLVRDRTTVLVPVPVRSEQRRPHATHR